MSVSVAFAIPSAPLPGLIVGAFFGYLLVLYTNPVRPHFRDGWLVVRRYSRLWVALGTFGFAYALFQLALRAYFFFELPPADRPTFVWMREGWRDPNLWLTGSPQSLWYLPPGSLRRVVMDCALPSLESVAGLFNSLIATFPLSALAALFFLVNWHGHHAVFWRAVRKRLGAWGWLIYAGIVLCALAAVAKPFLYAAPQILGLQAEAAELWFRWAPVVEWLSFVFEYLAGVCIQLALILIAYCWVRGLTFTQQHLVDFSIRRFSFVLKWALPVLVVSTVFIHLPLILKNFPAFQMVFSPVEAVVDQRWKIARAVLAGLLLFFSTMQITLTFHSESLGRAWRDHWRFVRKQWWPLAWFLILAGLHFFLARVGLELVQRGLGEGTAPGIAWGLIAPWLQALVAAWLLASWVCFFKESESFRLVAEPPAASPPPPPPDDKPPTDPPNSPPPPAVKDGDLEQGLLF